MLNDEVDLCAVFRPQVAELTFLEILQALLQLDAYPLLKDRPWIGQHRITRGD